MANFATATDVENGWRPLSYAERQDADLLLTVAANWIRDQLPLIEDSNVNAKYVSIDVVRSAIRMRKYAGLSQFSETVGGVSRSGTVANPSAGSVGLDFTDFHRKMLGLPLDGAQPQYSFEENDY